jgi:5'(3')-deoxyribonucleotidase
MKKIVDKINLFLDFDNCLCNAFKGIEAAYNHLYSSCPNFEPANGDKIRKYNMSDECKLLELKDVGKIFACDTFWENIKLFDGVEVILNDLKDHFNLIVVSIGTYENIQRKAHWIEYNLPIIDDSILLASDRVPCKANKSMINMQNGILIDDHMGNILSSNAKTKICYGRDGDWNESYYTQSDRSIYRLYDWYTIYWFLKDYILYNKGKK